MEEEAEKLKEMQKQVEETIMSPPASQAACKMKQLYLFCYVTSVNQAFLKFGSWSFYLPLLAPAIYM